jgi:hypothetical protein
MDVIKCKKCGTITLLCRWPDFQTMWPLVSHFPTYFLRRSGEWRLLKFATHRGKAARQPSAIRFFITTS